MLLWELSTMIPMKHFRERLSWSSGIINIYWLLLQSWGACWWVQSPHSAPTIHWTTACKWMAKCELEGCATAKWPMFDVLSSEAPCFNRETSLIGLYCLKETGLSNWRRVNLVRRNNQFMSLRQKHEPLLWCYTLPLVGQSPLTTEFR